MARNADAGTSLSKSTGPDSELVLSLPPRTWTRKTDASSDGNKTTTVVPTKLLV